MTVVCGESKSRYDSDFFGWTRLQANFLRKRQFSKSLGNSQLSDLESHLTILLLHLFKIKYQSMMHTRSWDLSIKNAKYHIVRLLEKNPGVKSRIDETLKDAYFTARLGAIDETGLEESIFPEDCEWTFEKMMSSQDEMISKQKKQTKNPRRQKIDK